MVGYTCGRQGKVGRAMRPPRNRRRLAAAGLVALSMFFCGYGDREDKQEDEKAKRAEIAPPWHRISHTSYGY